MNTPRVDQPQSAQPTGDECTSSFDSGSPQPPDVELGFLQPSNRPDSLGRLGHYEILEVLGRGGFGIVFRALDESLQRIVAVKVLAPELAATSPARKRFLREARSAAQVTHENVVRIYAVEEQPLPHLAMEFVAGETLQHWLDRTGPFDAAEVVAIGRQIAEGLSAAHACGLIHRDVKPGNILIELGSPMRVKVTDFGLARAADDASITQSGVIVGTPHYMSPEQARGDKLDHRSDLFSLGSVLYTITSGHPPFRSGTTLAILKRVSEDVPRPIQEIIPETPAWLCHVIAKLMSKDAGARYQNAAEVVAALAPAREVPHRRRWTPAHPVLGLVTIAVLALAGAVVIHHYLFQGRPDHVSRSDKGEKNSTGEKEKASGEKPANTEEQTEGKEKPAPRPPDLSKLNALFNDDFTDSAKCVVPILRKIRPTRENPFKIEDAAAQAYFHERRFVFELLHTEFGSPMAWAGSGIVTSDDFACLIECRLTGNGDVGWALLHDYSDKQGLAVSVGLDGRVELLEVEQPGSRRKKLQRLRPPVEHSVDQVTTLLVTFQGRQLTVFVDGSVVGVPIELERGIGAGKQSVAVWRNGTGDAKAEFTRFAVWRLPE